MVLDPLVSPDVLSFGAFDTHGGPRRSLTVRLPTVTSQPPPEIVAIITSVPGLRCRALDTTTRVEAALVYDLTCEAVPPLSEGPFNGETGVSYSALGREGVLSVPFTGNVLDGIAAFPSTVSFGFVSRMQRTRVRSVVLRSLRRPKLVPDRFTCDTPAIRLKAVEAQSKAEVTLRVELRPEHVNDTGAFTATIRVHSKDGGQVSIPVVAKLLSDE